MRSQISRQLINQYQAMDEQQRTGDLQRIDNCQILRWDATLRTSSQGWSIGNAGEGGPEFIP